MLYKTLYNSNVDFPNLLTEVSDCPERIIARGTIWDNSKYVIAVVGSRKVTNYGRAAVEMIVPKLAQAGIIVASGLAIGVDSLAHQAALNAGGQTVAVLPSSLDKVYPARHARLAEDIVKNRGVLISEYSSNPKPHRYDFVARNRIIAGISHATLIIEAASKSGSLITADFALQGGRTVFAVPGNINSQMSVGTNRLIKDGATPISSAQDIFDELGLEPKIAEQTDLNDNELYICELAKLEPGSLNQIIELSKLPPHLTSQIISELEIKGILANISGTFIVRWAKNNNLH